MLLQLSQFPLFAPSTQLPPQLPQAIPPPLFMSMVMCRFFGYYISYTVLYIHLAIL